MSGKALAAGESRKNAANTGGYRLAAHKNVVNSTVVRQARWGPRYWKSTCIGQQRTNMNSPLGVAMASTAPTPNSPTAAGVSGRRRLFHSPALSPLLGIT